MSHTYASVADLKDYLRDNGSTDLGSFQDDFYLTRLEAASRSVDAFCDRGPSGFGPRTATTRYVNDWCWRELDFRDDLAGTPTSITSIDIDGTTSLGTLTTGYYLDPLQTTPKRRLIITTGSLTGSFVDIAASWGYPTTTRTLVATVSGAIDTDDTPIIVSADPDISAGQTLLCGSEQMYVRRVEGTVVTLDRGVNGTTAASHLDGAALAAYVYDRSVVEATCAVAVRRMRMRDAGLVPDFGGQQAVVSPRDTERSLLRAIVGHLKVYGT